MRPERVEVVKRNKIEEFYWAGKLVVYVNNQKFDGAFEEAVKEHKEINLK